MSSTLVEEFHEAMVQVYVGAKREAKYNATWFLQMVETRGGLDAAHELLRAREVQTGLTALWERNRLDLSVEYLVLQPKSQCLFTDEERAVARQRLKDHGFTP